MLLLAILQLKKIKLKKTSLLSDKINMERPAYKTNLNCKTHSGSEIFSFVQKVFLILILSFSLQAFTDGHEEGGEELSTLDGIKKQCRRDTKGADSTVFDGDTASTATMQQTTAQATSAGGQSARAAHLGSAAINTVMMANAQKRCGRCKAAISKCRESCNFDEKCEKFESQSGVSPYCICSDTANFGCNIPPSVPGSDPCLNHRSECQSSCNTCEEYLEEKLEECEGYSNPCGQVCAQAGLSGLTALTNLLAARQLGNCVGEDCDKPPKDEDDPKNPDITPPNPTAPSAPGSSHLAEFGGLGDNVSTDPYKLHSGVAGSKTKTNSKGNNKRTEGNPYFGRESLNGNDKNTLKPLSGSSKGSMAGVAPSSGSQDGLGLFNGNKNSKPYKKLKDKKEGEDMDFGQGGFSPGGSFAGYQSSGGNSRRHYGGGRSSKDKDSKRGVSGAQADSKDSDSLLSQDTIFIRTSRLIVRFCNNSRC